LTQAIAEAFACVKHRRVRAATAKMRAWLAMMVESPLNARALMALSHATLRCRADQAASQQA
jgi:hypothetical protein